MGKTYQIHLPGNEIWCCISCKTHLVDKLEVISKDFHGATGNAYLFPQAVNIHQGKSKTQRLRSGYYIIADIYCNVCLSRLGWIYEKSFDEDGKYKEGKIILEKSLIQLVYNGDS